MNTATNWMIHDHRKYDDLLTECEIVAEAADWKQALNLFYQFSDELKLHMQIEDDVLYPLFVEQGDPEGNIDLLNDEHETIIRLMRDMVAVIKANNVDHFLESLEPLHEVMSNHNKHEEMVFSSMMSESIMLRKEEIMLRLKEIQSQNDHKDRDWGF